MTSTAFLHNCVIPSCTWQVRQKEENLSWQLIAAPDAEKRERWLQLFRTLKEDPFWIPAPSQRICSRHFVDSHSRQNESLSGAFDYSAVPTLYLRRQEESTKETSNEEFSGEKVNLDCHEVCCPNCLHQFSFFLHGEETEENDPLPPRKRPKVSYSIHSTSAPLNSRGDKVTRVTVTPKFDGQKEKEPLALEGNEYLLPTYRNPSIATLVHNDNRSFLVLKSSRNPPPPAPIAQVKSSLEQHDDTQRQTQRQLKKRTLNNKTDTQKTSGRKRRSSPKKTIPHQTKSTSQIRSQRKMRTTSK